MSGREAFIGETTVEFHRLTTWVLHRRTQLPSLASFESNLPKIPTVTVTEKVSLLTTL